MVTARLPDMGETAEVIAPLTIRTIGDWNVFFSTDNPIRKKRKISTRLEKAITLICNQSVSVRSMIDPLFTVIVLEVASLAKVKRVLFIYYLTKSFISVSTSKNPNKSEATLSPRAIKSIRLKMFAGDLRRFTSMQKGDYSTMVGFVAI